MLLLVFLWWGVEDVFKILARCNLFFLEKDFNGGKDKTFNVQTNYFLESKTILAKGKTRFLTEGEGED